MKKIIAIMLIGVMIVLAGCGGGNTVKTREEAKALMEEFYAPLESLDSYKMSSYYNDELATVVTKEQDKIHMEIIDEEFGYDYFGFIEDEKKYIITDDRTLVEDEFTYDMAGDSLRMLIEMTLYGYVETDVEGMSYSATKKSDNELVTTIKGEDGGTTFEIVITGKKADGNITEIVSEIKGGDEPTAMKYEFTYGEQIELPEYTVPKTYDNMPHVDSPYKTFGEIIEKLGEEEDLSYYFMENQLIVIGENEERHYQFSTIVDQDTLDKYNELDIMNDDYETKAHELIYGIEIEDCIDFTDEILSKEEMETYIGGTIDKMLEEGFEVNGYSFWEGDNSVYVVKDYMDYLLKVDLPEGFDPEGEFEYEELGPCTIKSIEFNDVEGPALPMK